MVFKRFKVKTEGESSAPHTHEDIRELDKDGLQSRLQEVRLGIDAIKLENADLIIAKENGTLHDGQYNIETTATSMRLQLLKEQEQALLVRIDDINRNIGGNTLKAS